jgi:hypothetical protein
MHLQEVEQDLRLVFQNVIYFNGPQHDLSLVAKLILNELELLLLE